jgi:hypothetical protein
MLGCGAPFATGATLGTAGLISLTLGAGAALGG